jgi:hypothetical protein
VGQFEVIRCNRRPKAGVSGRMSKEFIWLAMVLLTLWHLIKLVSTKPSNYRPFSL